MTCRLAAETGGRDAASVPGEGRGHQLSRRPPLQRSLSGCARRSIISFGHTYNACASDPSRQAPRLTICRLLPPHAPRRVRAARPPNASSRCQTIDSGLARRSKLSSTSRTKAMPPVMPAPKFDPTAPGSPPCRRSYIRSHWRRSFDHDLRARAADGEAFARLTCGDKVPAVAP